MHCGGRRVNTPAPNSVSTVTRWIPCEQCNVGRPGEELRRDVRASTPAVMWTFVGAASIGGTMARAGCGGGCIANSCGSEGATALVTVFELMRRTWPAVPPGPAPISTWDECPSTGDDDQSAVVLA